MQMLIPESVETVESTSESLEGTFLSSREGTFLVSDEEEFPLESDEFENSEDLEDAEQMSLSTMQPLVFEGLKDVSRVNLVGIPMIYRRGSNFRMGKTLNKGPRHLKVSTMGMKTRKQMSSEDTYVLAPVLMSQEVYETLFDEPDSQFERINQIASNKASD
jgi:hypothetical protein